MRRARAKSSSIINNDQDVSSSDDYIPPDDDFDGSFDSSRFDNPEDNDSTILADAGIEDQQNQLQAAVISTTTSTAGAKIPECANSHTRLLERQEIQYEKSYAEIKVDVTRYQKEVDLYRDMERTKHPVGFCLYCHKFKHNDPTHRIHRKTKICGRQKCTDVNLCKAIAYHPV
jgi:hypothetical protein